MKKSLLTLLLFIATFASASQHKMTHAHAVDVEYKNSKGELTYVIVARDLPLKCRENIEFEPANYWKDDFAAKEVDPDCKASYITSAGKISPMKMREDIETYGELEVVEYLEDMHDDPNRLFIDARKVKWFESLTIPGAINIPFVYFTEGGKWDKEKAEALAAMGVVKNGSSYDFSNAKTILLFCNAIWCRQSPQMIEALLEIGYPAEKMKWYRGGIQSWTSVGMTTYRPVSPIKAAVAVEEDSWFEVLVKDFERVWDSVLPS